MPKLTRWWLILGLLVATAAFCNAAPARAASPSTASAPHASNCPPGSTDPMCQPQQPPPTSGGGSNCPNGIIVLGFCVQFGGTGGSNQPCTFGGTPSTGASCVPCPSGGSATFSNLCPQTQQAACTYGGQPSVGFPCVQCPGGGTAVYLSECPQATNCTYGVAYATTSNSNPCIPCPGGAGTAATTAQCPTGVSCSLGGAVFPPASCFSCPGGAGTAVSQSACPVSSCTYGGSASPGFQCVPCPGGGNAAFLSACPQAQTCNTGITYALSGCVQCPGGSNAATQAQCPQSMTCDLGGSVYPPASCVPCTSGLTAVSQSACPAAQLPCSDGTATTTQCTTCTDSTTTANTCKSCTDGSTTALSCKSCSDGTTTSNTCTSCIDGTSTAQACRSCTDGTTTSKVCNSCNDGTTANQCTSCTDGTNSFKSPCPTTCPDGSTTANAQCPPPGPRASGPDPCVTEQSAFGAADTVAHSTQNSLQILRNTQKSADDAYNTAVLNAAGKYGVAAAFAVASVGSSALLGIGGAIPGVSSSAIYSTLGLSTSAVSGLGALMIETTVKALGQSLAQQAIQSVQGKGLNFADLWDNTKSKDAKAAILQVLQDAATSNDMQTYSTANNAVSPTSDQYGQVQGQVADTYKTAFKNLGSALTLYSLSGSLSAQGNIDAIGAFDNAVTADISAQEQQLQTALNDLDNARSALNYCRGLHPEYTPNSNSSGS